jgi:hypothetical protein
MREASWYPRAVCSTVWERVRAEMPRSNGAAKNAICEIALRIEGFIIPSSIREGCLPHCIGWGKKPIVTKYSVRCKSLARIQ